LVIEGKVSGLTTIRKTFITRDDGGLYIVRPTDTIEVLAPKFEDGALYLSPVSGYVYKYSASMDGFKTPQGYEHNRLNEVTRDELVKLVAEHS